MAHVVGDRPRSPLEGIHIIENFLGNGTITTNLVGEKMWTITNIANAGTYAYLTTITANDPPGGIRHTTAGTADGDGDALHCLADSILLYGSAKGGGFAFRAKYPNIAGNALAGNDFRIGLESSVTAAAPTDGISVFSDAGVITLRSDSADHGDGSQAAASVSTFTSGTTMVLDVWHDFEVIWAGTNGQGGPREVTLYIDGEEAASLYSEIDNDETVELKITHYQNSGGADTLELDVAFFEYWQFMDYPTASAV